MAGALKIAGLIESVRGVEGGYRLARPASGITVLDIYDVLDGTGDLIDCRRDTCGRLDVCGTSELWIEMSQAIRHVLGSKTLQQLAAQEVKLQKHGKVPLVGP